MEMMTMKTMMAMMTVMTMMTITGNHDNHDKKLSCYKGLFTYYVSRRRGGRGYGKC